MSESTTEEMNTLGFTSLAEGLQKNFKRVEDVMTDFAKSYEDMDMDPFNLTSAYQEWLASVGSNPQKLIEANLAYMQNATTLYQQSVMSVLGINAEPVVTEEKGDRRFKHDDWAEKPVFGAIKQSYLLASQWMRGMVSDMEGLDEQTAQKVKFFTERYIDAMSPTNFAVTNPAVIEKTLETKGANLVHGLRNMLEDLERGKGQLQIRMTDAEAFELGKNVAVTPGKVVFQNRMFQLIQYTPTTDTVFEKPLLVVPPWINKFYIMDLQPKNSLLRWLISQGHTVFVVSWINPDESYRDTTFEDYMKGGVITAVDVVEQISGVSEINSIGYCIGGTLLTSTLAYMKSKGDMRIKSATFFTTMLDFSDPGELGVFIDQEQISSLEVQMEKDGYLEGSSMAGAFNLMRANDLIWSFYINNYLLGNDPRPFDLLYWNSDSTRMPAKMHSWYLRNMYLDNRLCKPGGLTIDGVPIDVSTIDIPVCFASTVEDHIAPWKSTYAGAQLFSGDVRFILGGSGHIAGVINPPEAGKYGFRLTDGLPDDPDAWASKAENHPGSWWPEWQNWIAPQSGEQIEARIPGSGKFKALEEAPGSYVKARIGVPADEPEQIAATPAATEATPEPAQKEASVKPETKVATDKPEAPAKDDLTVISGIGPALARLLQSKGISSYADLAGKDPGEIRELLDNEGAKYKKYNPSSWPEQAKSLL
ncbi:MAG: class I poly(R)-hydroxyalkanoic acid synthase [Gammaproteobacteria bacterium]|nr:class I poly(R)-hydroxyalkanoic acid synthase [Gammaproteobacteria bacterium]